MSDKDCPCASAVSEACIDHSRKLFPGAEIALLEHQGGCSLTIVVQETHEKDNKHGNEHILQFRPAQFQVDLRVAETARMIHGSLVPMTSQLAWFKHASASLQVLQMQLMPGVNFGRLQPRQRVLGQANGAKVQVLLEGLAENFAYSWHSGERDRHYSGRVGASMHARLEQLCKHLPAWGLRQRALAVLSRVEAGDLSLLPTVLTHGDLLPSNLLVEEQTWLLEGIIDWAEAEYLPFGVALYSLERLLGHIDSWSRDQVEFVYYAEADTLRMQFWQRLTRLIPELNDTALYQAVSVARDVGVLLWFGFAWDGGSISRVINAASDPEELAFLRAVLRPSGEPSAQSNTTERCHNVASTVQAVWLPIKT